MYRIAIVEDDIEAGKTLLASLKRFGEAKQIGFETDIFSNGLEFLEEYDPAFDVVFMDIQMPFLDGMETAKRLRKVDPKVVLIFVTNMAQFAIKGYEVDALSFLVKPVSYYSFETTLDKALKASASKKKSTILVPAGDGWRKIAISDILYIEVSNHDLYYVTDKEEIRPRDSLKRIENELIPLGFAKCSSSYLVNLAHVKGVAGDRVNGEKYSLKMSRGQKKAFNEAFVNYIGERI